MVGSNLFSARRGLAVALAVILFSIFGAMAQAAPYAAMVIDARTGEVLHSRNADSRLHPASLTKMMTLYIAFQAVENGEISLDDKVTISKHAASEPPSKLGLRSGQKIAFRYLIRAAAVKSANDAATAIGEAISGSEAAFARRMTRTAKQLGMTNTTFKNAHGLTQSGHLSTARDMTTLGRHVFYDYPEYYNLFARKSTSAGIKTVNNTNRRLLGSYRGADGIKTGYTRAAGYNLVASARRGQERIIATVFGGKSTASRNQRVAELLNMGFERAPSRAPTRKPARPTYLANSDISGAKPGVYVRANGAPTRSLRPVLRPGLGETLIAEGEQAEVEIVARADTGAINAPELRPLARIDLQTEKTSIDEAVTAALVEVETATVGPVENPQPVLRPEVAQQPVETVEKVQVPDRPANADNKEWAISIGLFHTEYMAEKQLLRTALAEVSTLKQSRRAVVRTPRGFDANFQGLTWDAAMQACERLRARSMTCSMISG